jgi:hypothetical protein
MSLDRRIKIGSLVEVFDFPEDFDQLIGIVLDIHRNFRDNFIVLYTTTGIQKISLDIYSYKIFFIQSENQNL